MLAPLALCRRALLAAPFALLLAALAPACGGPTDSSLLTPPEDAASADTGKPDVVIKDATGDAKDAANEAPPTDYGIQCGGNPPCPVPGKECCRQGTSNFTFQCVDTGQCDAQGNSPLTIPCDDAADCAKEGMPGTVCCVTADQNGFAQEIVCRAPTDCQKKDGRSPMCDPNVSNSCPPNEHCAPSVQTIPGYYICIQ